MLQSNATLTKVSGASGGESFDGPAAAGPEKWAGSAPAYLRESRDRQLSAAGGDRVLVRSLIVQNDNPSIAWRSGDIAEITFAGDQLVVTVKLVERRAVTDPDIPPEVQTTRLTLEAA